MSEALVSRLLAELLGNREIIAYPPAIARAIGCAEATLFLAQGLHWQSKIGLDEWFYKLRDCERDSDGNMLPPSGSDKQSWEWELGLSRAKQESARRKLKAHGLLEEKLCGVPAKLHYRIPLDRVASFLLSQLEEKSPTGWGRSVRQGGELKPHQSERSQPALTKTTSEISTKTTTTTFRAARGSSGVSDLDLQIEKSIERHREVLIRILGSIDSVKDRQEIADEFAGATEAAAKGLRGQIGSARGWLEEVVRRYQSGQFFMDLGEQIQKRRAENASDKTPVPISEIPSPEERAATRAMTEQRMSEIRSLLSAPRRTKSI